MPNLDLDVGGTDEAASNRARTPADDRALDRSGAVVEMMERQRELVLDEVRLGDPTALEATAPLPSVVVALAAAGLWVAAIGTEAAFGSAAEVAGLTLAYLAKMSESSDVFKGLLVVATLLGVPLGAYSILENRSGPEDDG